LVHRVNDWVHTDASIMGYKILEVFLVDLYYVFTIDPSDRKLYLILRDTLKTQSIILFGIFFGGLNTGLGLFYGIWYDVIVLNISLLVLFFFVGFICGLAICGIVGVIRLVNCVCSMKNLHLDLTSDDGCGGTSTIGNMLLKFSAVSLAAGFSIAYYIYNSPWANKGWFPVTFTIYLWMLFPHMAAVAVLLVPLLKLHNVLKIYKTHHLKKLKEKRDVMRKNVLGITDRTSIDAERHCKLLTTQYYIFSDMLNELDKVRIWPYETRISFSFALTWFLTFLVPLFEIWER